MDRRIIRQRKCVVCGNRTNQGELVRVSLTSSCELDIGGSARRLGRGAYLCSVRSCFEGAMRSNRLARALRTEVTDTWETALGGYLGREGLTD